MPLVDGIPVGWLYCVPMGGRCAVRGFFVSDICKRSHVALDASYEFWLAGAGFDGQSDM